MKDPRGLRYANQWIYECLLIKIKSRKTYIHLRKHKILVLPSIRTLDKYIKVIGGSYGFLENTFKILAQKTAKMKKFDLRGTYEVALKVRSWVAVN